MNPNRIKLPVTLVLFALAVTSAWLASRADARGLSSPGASSHWVATRPGAGIASGDPDAGQGVAPAPPPAVKALHDTRVGGGRSSSDWSRWMLWTSRIWATLFQRAAQ